MAFKDIFSSKKEKKELTKKQQTVRTVLNWVTSVICIVVIVFALVVAIFTIAGASNDDHLMKFGGKIYMNVASDSMEPVFCKGDMIIVDAFNAETDMARLKVGQVVTFRTVINGYNTFNTHRIIHIRVDDNGNTRIYTRGDNRLDENGNVISWQDSLYAGSDVPTSKGPDGTWDPTSIDPKKIVATWGSVDDNGTFTSGKLLKGVGSFSNWIQDTDHPGEDSSAKVRFFCVIVLPLILLFVIYAFVLVRTLIIAKLENSKPVVSENSKPTIDSLSDEEKRRLAEEYLASLALQMKNDAPAENPAEPPASEPQDSENPDNND